jgi:hypothetical protein
MAATPKRTIMVSAIQSPLCFSQMYQMALAQLLDTIEIRSQKVQFHQSAKCNEDTLSTIVVFSKARLSIAHHGGSGFHIPSEWLGHLPCLERKGVSHSCAILLDTETVECHLLKGQHAQAAFRRVPSVVFPLKIRGLLQGQPSFSGHPTSQLFDGPSSPVCVMDVTLSRVAVGLDPQQIADLLQLLRPPRPASVPSEVAPWRLPSLHIYARSEGLSFCLTSKEEIGVVGSVIGLETGTCFIESHITYNEAPFSGSGAIHLKEERLLAEGHGYCHWESLRIHAHPFERRHRDFLQSLFHNEAHISEADPICTLESFECTMDWTASAVQSPTSPLPSLDPLTIMLRYMVVLDDLAVEIWKEEAIETLALIASQIPALIARQDNPPEVQPTVHVVPRYVSGVCSVTTATFLVTGRDLNPDCDLMLSRGICLRTRIRSSYASTAAEMDKGSRFMNELARNAELRKNLGLQLDCASQRIRRIPTSPERDREGLSLVHLALDNVVVRRAVSTPYGSNISHHQELEVGFGDLNPDLILVKSSSMEILIWSLSDGNLKFSTAQRKISIHIADLEAQFQLLSAYACLCASRTLQLIGERWPPLSKPPPITKQAPPVDISLQLDRSRLLCLLPLGQTLLITALGITNQKNQHTDGSVFAIHSLAAYVPNGSSRWIQVISTDGVRCSFPECRDSTQVEMEHLLITIPWGFIVADLILDFVLTFKALRHLVKLNNSASFEEFQEPEAELPKIIPKIEISCVTFKFEVEDDPFEAALGIIWSTGTYAQRVRLDRDIAFASKVAAIQESRSLSDDVPDIEEEDHPFDSAHTVSIENAQKRLQTVHSMTWIQIIREAKRKNAFPQGNYSRSDNTAHEKFLGATIETSQIGNCMLTATLDHLVLHVEPLSLSPDAVFARMGELGGEMPPTTSFTVWVPLHLEVRSHKVDLTLRDFPIPLLNISPRDPGTEGFVLLSDLIVAEELGPPSSTLWLDCLVSKVDHDAPGASAFSFHVPKTVMPVKIYAKPELRVTSPSTIIAWAVSYLPAIQGVAKVFESFSHSPPDSSPPLGFWDKVWFFLITISRALILF